MEKGEPCNIDGTTPLHFSIVYYKVEIFKFLLEWKGPEKVELEAKNMYGETPLQVAARNGCNEDCLSHGAFLKAKANKVLRSPMLTKYFRLQRAYDTQIEIGITPGVLLPAYLVSVEWQKHHAAMIWLAQIVEGCSKVMIKNLEQVVSMVLNSFQDPHPRVHWDTINATWQLSIDLGPDLQAQYHHECCLIWHQLWTTFKIPECIHLDWEFQMTTDLLLQCHTKEEQHMQFP